MTTAATAIAIATAAAATRISRALKLGVSGSAGTRRAEAHRDASIASASAERVADTADGVDQPRLAIGLELAAEIGHIHLERVGAGTEIVAPDLLEDARPAEDDARVAHEQLQQAELRA